MNFICIRTTNGEGGTKKLSGQSTDLHDGNDGNDDGKFKAG